MDTIWLNFLKKISKIMVAKSYKLSFVPFPTMDFAPYISKVDPTADALLSVHAGADGVRLVKQFKQYGKWNKMALTGGALIIQELLEAMGDDGLGIKGAMFYSTEIDTPENKRYVKAYLEEYKKLPGSLSPCGYEAATAILMALQEIEQDIDNLPGSAGFQGSFSQSRRKSKL